LSGDEILPTASDAEAIAREHWGLQCQAEPLAGEVDRNFLLVTDSGDRWVLKISREDTDRVGLEYQIEALRFLENSLVAELVQQPLPTTDGRYLLPYERNGCEDCWARILSFMDGSPLVNFRERPPALLEEVGRALARLDLALRDFEHPGAHRDHPWNLERAHDLGQYSELITDTARR
jgi:Ser/Thr protein kinase RdoA (MazF antagonist)